MKAITIWQPWASLIMCGARPYEFRERSYLEYINHPQPGARVGIHAAVRPVKIAEVYELLMSIEGGEDATGLIVAIAKPLLARLMDAPKCRGVLPLGALLGTATIGTPRNARELFGHLPHDSDRGDFNWAWPFSDHEVFMPPIEMNGARGFWTWTCNPLPATVAATQGSRS